MRFKRAIPTFFVSDFIMLSRSTARLFSSDFAHKQVSSGFTKKYGENFDNIFGKKKPTTVKETLKDKDTNATNKSESK